MSPSLHQTLLMVTDLDASTAFYRDVVGLESDVVNDGNVEFDSGQCTLVLESDFGRDVLDAFGLEEPGDERGKGVIAAIDAGSPEGVDEVHERAVDADVTVRMEPRDVDWGRRMMLLADPDGYTVEVSAAL
ncbi:VOC family protein [Halobacterium sp. KA-4]|uniref:VOC family protein n=1 Tax=Halobacterium sp. KA-4 TaxID=2896367 RepID=UPI001E2D7D91|nr:VOC family protein [Halobacterium sp. KA-4]MCD2201686.1 VOC family protein [Halobacterium sp. KA-4]